MRQHVVDPASQPIRNYHANPGAESPVTGWANNSAALHTIYVRETTGGRTGGSCYRIARSADTTDTFRVSSVYISGYTGLFAWRVTPGERVYASAYIKPERANRGARVRFTFRDATDIVGNSVAGGLQSSVTPISAGLYSRVEFSQIVPANAASVIAVFEVVSTDASLPVTGEQVWYDDGMFTKGVTSTPHADGNTLGWRWLGTPEQSESVGYPDPASFIRNRLPNPSLTSTVNGWAGNDGTLYTTNRVSTGGVDGGPCFEVVRTATNPGTGAASIYTHGYPFAGGLLQVKVTPGETIQGSWAVKNPLPNRRGTIYLQFRDAAGAVVAPSSAGQTSVVLPTAGYNRVFTAPVVVPAGADSVLLAGTVVATDAVPVPGGEVTNFDQAVIGPPHATYYDGDSQGWRWTGTPHASESIGYPSTLEGIAGAPLASLTAAGSSAPLGLGGYEGRTLYVVHDVLSLASQSFAPAQIGKNWRGGLAVRMEQADSARLTARVETLLPDTEIKFAIQNTARTIGRHVSVGTVAEGVTSASAVVDNSSEVRIAVNPGSGLSTGVDCILVLAAPTANDVPIAAYAFQGEHDLVTRRRILAWLARRYGAPVPAGY